MNGYSRDGVGKCKPLSPAKKSQYIFIFFGTACHHSFPFLFLIWTTVIKRGGAIRISDGAKIFISFAINSLSNNNEYTMANKLHESFPDSEYGFPQLERHF